MKQLKQDYKIQLVPKIHQLTLDAANTDEFIRVSLGAHIEGSELSLGDQFSLCTARLNFEFRNKNFQQVYQNWSAPPSFQVILPSARRPYRSEGLKIYYLLVLILLLPFSGELHPLLMGNL